MMNRRGTATNISFLPRILSQYILVVAQNCEFILMLFVSLPVIDLTYYTRVCYILLSFPQLLSVSICSTALQRIKALNQCDYCSRGFYLLPNNPRFSCSCRSMHIKILRHYTLFLVAYGAFSQFIMLSNSSLNELTSLYLVFACNSVCSLFIVSVSPLTVLQRFCYSILGSLAVIFYIGIFNSAVSLIFYTLLIHAASSIIHSIIQRIDAFTEVMEYTTFNHGFLRLTMSIFQTLAPPEFLYRMIPSYSKQTYKFKLSNKRQEFLKSYTLQNLCNTFSPQGSSTSIPLSNDVPNTNQEHDLDQNQSQHHSISGHTKSSPDLLLYVHNPITRRMHSSSMAANSSNSYSIIKYSKKKCVLKDNDDRVSESIYLPTTEPSPTLSRSFRLVSPLIKANIINSNNNNQELSFAYLLEPVYKVLKISDAELSSGGKDVVNSYFLRKRNPIVKYEVDMHIHERYVLLCAIHIQRPVMSMLNAKTVHTIPDELNYLAILNLLFSMFDYILSNFFSSKACIHKLKADDKTYYAYVDLSYHASLMFKEKIEPIFPVDNSVIDAHITQSKASCLQTVLTFVSLASYFVISMRLECSALIIYTRTVLGFFGSGNHSFDMINPGISVLRGIFNNFYEVYQDTSLMPEHSPENTHSNPNIKPSQRKPPSNNNNCNTPFVTQISLNKMTALDATADPQTKLQELSADRKNPSSQPTQCSHKRHHRKNSKADILDTGRQVIMDNRIFFINQVRGYNSAFSTKDFFTDIPRDIFIAELIDTDELLSILQSHTRVQSAHYDIYNLLPPCYNLLPVSYSIRHSLQGALRASRLDINYEYCRFFEVIPRPEIATLLIKLLIYSLSHDIKTTQPYPVEEVLNSVNFDALCSSSKASYFTDLAFEISQDPMLLNFISLASYQFSMQSVQTNHSDGSNQSSDLSTALLKNTAFKRLFPTIPESVFLPDVLLHNDPESYPSNFVTMTSTGFLPPYMRSAVKAVIMHGLKQQPKDANKDRTVVEERHFNRYSSVRERTDSCNGMYDDRPSTSTDIMRLRVSSDKSTKKPGHLKNFSSESMHPLHTQHSDPQLRLKLSKSGPALNLTENKSTISLSRFSPFGLANYNIGTLSRIKQFRMIPTASLSIWRGDKKSDIICDSTHTLASSDYLADGQSHNMDNYIELSYFQGTCYSTVSRTINTFDDVLKKLSDLYNPDHIHYLTFNYTPNDYSMFYGTVRKFKHSNISMINMDIETYYREVLNAPIIPKEIISHYREELYDELLLLFPEAYDIIPKAVFMSNCQTIANYHAHRSRTASRLTNDSSSRCPDSQSNTSHDAIHIGSEPCFFISESSGNISEDMSINVSTDIGEYSSHDNLISISKRLPHQFNSTSSLLPRVSYGPLELIKSSPKLNLMKDIPYSATISDFGNSKSKLYGPFSKLFTKSVFHSNHQSSIPKLPTLQNVNAKNGHSKTRSNLFSTLPYDSSGILSAHNKVDDNEPSAGEVSFYGNVKTSEIPLNRSCTSESEKPDLPDYSFKKEISTFHSFLSKSGITTGPKVISFNEHNEIEGKLVSKHNYFSNSSANTLSKAPNTQLKHSVKSIAARNFKRLIQSIPVSAKQISFTSSFFTGTEIESTEEDSISSSSLTECISDLNSCVFGSLTNSNSNQNISAILPEEEAKSMHKMDSNSNKFDIGTDINRNSHGSTTYKTTEETNLYVLSISQQQSTSYDTRNVSFSSSGNNSSIRSYSTSLESDDDIGNVVTIVDPSHHVVDIDANFVSVSFRDSETYTLRESRVEAAHSLSEIRQLNDGIIFEQPSTVAARMGRTFRSSFEISGASVEQSSDLNTPRNSSVDFIQRSCEGPPDCNSSIGTSSTLYNVFKNPDDDPGLKASLLGFFYKIINKIESSIRRPWPSVLDFNAKSGTSNVSNEVISMPFSDIQQSKGEDPNQAPMQPPNKQVTEPKKLTVSSITNSVPYLNQLFDNLQTSTLLYSTFSFMLFKSIKHCTLLFKLMIPSFCMPGVLIQASFLIFILLLFSLKTNASLDGLLDTNSKYLGQGLSSYSTFFHTIKIALNRSIFYTINVLIRMLTHILAWLNSRVHYKSILQASLFAHGHLQRVSDSLRQKISSEDNNFMFSQFLSGQKMLSASLRYLYAALFFISMYAIILYLNKHIKNCYLKSKITKLEMYSYNMIFILNIYCLELFSNVQLLRVTYLFNFIKGCQFDLKNSTSMLSNITDTNLQIFCSKHITVMNGIFMKIVLHLSLIFIASVIYWFVLTSAITIPPLLLSINGVIIFSSSLVLKFSIAEVVPYVMLCYSILVLIIFLHARSFLVSYILILKTKVSILLNWCQSQRMFKLLISDHMFSMLIKSIRMHEILSILTEKNSKINVEMAKNMGLKCYILSTDSMNHYFSDIPLIYKKYKQPSVNNCGFLIQTGTSYRNSVIDSIVFEDFFSDKTTEYPYSSRPFWDNLAFLINKSLVQPIRLYLYNISLLIGFKWSTQRQIDALHGHISELSNVRLIHTFRKSGQGPSPSSSYSSSISSINKNTDDWDPGYWKGYNTAYFYDSSLKTVSKYAGHTLHKSLHLHIIPTQTKQSDVLSNWNSDNKGARHPYHGSKSVLTASDEFIRGYTSYNDNRRLGMKRYAEVSSNSICMVLSLSNLFYVDNDLEKPASQVANRNDLIEFPYKVQINEAFYMSSIQFQIFKEFLNILTTYLTKFGKHMVIVSASFYKVEICINCDALLTDEKILNNILASLNNTQLGFKSIFISARTMLPVAIKTLNNKYFKKTYPNIAPTPLLSRLPVNYLNPKKSEITLDTCNNSDNDFADSIQFNTKYTKEELCTAIALCDALTLGECMQMYVTERVTPLLPKAYLSIGIAHGLCIETILGNYGRSFCIHGAAVSKARYIAECVKPNVIGLSNTAANVHARLKSALENVIESNYYTIDRLGEELIERNQNAADLISIQGILAAYSRVCNKESYGYSIV